MINIQSIGCQPIRKIYSNQAFGRQVSVEDDPFLEELSREKEGFEEIRNNGGNKVLSTVGTIGAAGAAAALQFFTFKALAPKAGKALLNGANKLYNTKPVKASFDNVCKGFSFVRGKVSKFFVDIKPESKMGKLKSAFNEKVRPFFTKMFNSVKEFAQKHNLNREFAKKSLLNTGAVCVSIPAAITTANLSENGGVENV